MKRVQGVRRQRRSFREILNDRALVTALLFSAAVHMAAILLVKFPAVAPSPQPGGLMVARLVHLPGVFPAAGEPSARREDPVAPGRVDRPPPPAVEQTLREDGGGKGDVTVEADGGGAASFRSARVAGGLSLVLAPAESSLKGPVFASSTAAGADGSARTLLARPAAPKRSAEVLLNEIRRLIDRRKVYPRIARRNGWEGRVLVELSLVDGGTLEDVRIVDASGYRVLDSATVKAVRRAGPYPPLEGKVRVPVTYRLKE